MPDQDLTAALRASIVLERLEKLRAEIRRREEEALDTGEILSGFDAFRWFGKKLDQLEPGGEDGKTPDQA